MSSEQSTCMGCFVNNPADWLPYGLFKNQHIYPSVIKIDMTSPDDKPIPPPADLLSPLRLTDDEKLCLYHLAQAWEFFNRLPDKLPADNPEFVDAIHAAQKMLALRVARRVNPNIWKQPDKI